MALNYLAGASIGCYVCWSKKSLEDILYYSQSKKLGTLLILQGWWKLPKIKGITFLIVSCMCIETGFRMTTVLVEEMR